LTRFVIDPVGPPVRVIVEIAPSQQANIILTLTEADSSRQDQKNFDIVRGTSATWELPTSPSQLEMDSLHWKLIIGDIEEQDVNYSANVRVVQGTKDIETVPCRGTFPKTRIAIEEGQGRFLFKASGAR